MNGLITQVGYAMTTFQRETDQPVIGFDMGGNVGLGDLMSLYYKWSFQLQNKFKKIILIIAVLLSTSRCEYFYDPHSTAAIVVNDEISHLLWNSCIPGYAMLIGA